MNGTISFDYFVWKSVQGHGLWAVGSTRGKKEAEKTSLMRNFAHTGKRNPLSDRE